MKRSEMPPAQRRAYWCWADMLSRCRSPTHHAYASYGGRGITVCERWHTFDNFWEDLGPRPDGRSLDREDNDGPYNNVNCRWATSQEQNSNRRNCIYVFDREERITLREMCRRRALPYRAIVKRIRYGGWPIADALSIPIASGKHFRAPHRREAA